MASWVIEKHEFYASFETRIVVEFVWNKEKPYTINTIIFENEKVTEINTKEAYNHEQARKVFIREIARVRREKVIKDD